MSGETPSLHWADYVVTVLCLAIALGIGLFFALFRGGQKTREEYLVGNRGLSLAPVCLSVFVTFQSAISLLGTPSDTYRTGLMVLCIFLGIALAYLLASLTVVPLVHPLRLTSVYHYLHLRFRSPGLTYLVTCIGMVQTSLFMGIALYSPALVLQAVAGLSLWVSLMCVGTVGTVYTAIGGMKSVIWTDVFQTGIVFTGIVAGIIKGLLSVGGFRRMVEIASDGGRLDFEIDPKARHSVWSTVIGGCFMWMISLFNQSSIQRICSLRSLRDAKRCYLLNIPLNLLYGATLCLMGVLLYAYFSTVRCDPLAAGYITNQNQVAPYFMLHVLSDMPGMAGVYMSMLFSGALSTLSSGINGLAANTVEDVLASPLRGVRDETVTVVAKVAVLFFGGLSMGLAYLMKNLPGPVTQLSNSVTGALGSPVLGVLFLAAAFPRCNIYGAGGGIVVGSVVSLTVAVGSTLHASPTPSLPPGPTDRCDVTNSSALWNLTEAALMRGEENSVVNTTVDFSQHSADSFSLWDISYLWFSVIGFTATVLSGIAITLCTGSVKDGSSVDPRLLFPCCRQLYGLREEERPAEEGTALPVKGQGRKSSEGEEMSAALNMLAHREAEVSDASLPNDHIGMMFN